ncbi:MAG TPA: oligosaccharide flippase family protein [Methanomicrobiales archaeon]|nr:oligosaccharide flippase family protein [Methanomicrobiales archaeon]
MKRTLAFYSGLFLLLLVLQKASGAVTKIILARSLAPADYGVITLVTLSLPALLQVVTNLNFYEMLSHSKEGKEYFGFSVVVSLLLTAAISLAIWIFREGFFSYLNIGAREDLLFFSLVFTLLATTLMVDLVGLYTGLKRYTLPGILNAIPSISKMLLVAVLVLSGSGSFGVLVLAITLTNALPALYLLVSRKGRQDLGLLRPIRIPSARIFAFGASLLLVGSFSTIGQSLIRIVISHELGMEWQGYFDVSLTFGSLILFTVGTMSFISIPEATGCSPDQLGDRGALGDIARTLLAGTILISILLYAYSGALVPLLFSRSYQPAGDYFPLLIPGYFLLFVLQFHAGVAICLGRDLRDSLRVILVPLLCLPLFFFLPLFLIHAYGQGPGGNGFSAAYLSYSAIVLVCTVGTILASGTWRPLAILAEKAGRLIVSSVLAIGVLVILHPGPVIGIPLITILFGAAIFGTRYVSPGMIREIFQRGGDEA